MNEAMTRTRKQLLENFDDEVREKLRVRDVDSKAYLNLYERLLMQLTQYELAGCAEFLNDSSFHLNEAPFQLEIPLGLYELPRRSGEAHFYGAGHPLAEGVIAQAKGRVLPSVEVCFDLNAHDGRISLLEPLAGQSGWLTVSLFSIEAFEQAVDRFIFSMLADSGVALEEEVAKRLLTVPGRVGAPVSPPHNVVSAMEAHTLRRQKEIQREVSERNARFFEEEVEKLDGWADDLKVGLEREIKEINRQIKEARRAATVALTLEEKIAGQKQVRNQKRRVLLDAQDAVDRRRQELIEEIEMRLKQQVVSETMFTLRWRML